jgi:hypothetical protein
MAYLSQAETFGGSSWYRFYFISFLLYSDMSSVARKCPLKHFCGAVGYMLDFMLQ